MDFFDAVFLVAYFAFFWLLVAFIAAGLDVALRKLFGMRLFPDNYWRGNDDCR